MTIHIIYFCFKGIIENLLKIQCQHDLYLALVLLTPNALTLGSDYNSLLSLPEVCYCCWCNCLIWFQFWFWFWVSLEVISFGGLFSPGEGDKKWSDYVTQAALKFTLQLRLASVIPCYPGSFAQKLRYSNRMNIPIAPSFSLFL